MFADETDDMSTDRLKAVQLKLPVVEAIEKAPGEIIKPVAGTLIVSFFVLRWLMK